MEQSAEEKAKEQKSKRAKEQKIGRHPAGPGRAGVLRIETAGAVSTLMALIADAGAVGMAGFGQKRTLTAGLNAQAISGEDWAVLSQNWWKGKATARSSPRKSVEVGAL